MTHEQLSAKQGGEARCAYDFTYEVAYVNRRIAKRLRGETPEPWQAEGWVVCPADFMAKDKARADIAESLDEVLQEWEKLDPAEMNKEIQLANGSKTNPIDLAYMCAYHTGYHDAQLNYIQALQGDSKMHWGEAK